ncbi:MAG TPA: hypothetical protein VMB26_11670 [Candidatus Binataceae bacterium]|nr:hypothetical protein [Candidatus Binataceae bacterium]
MNSIIQSWFDFTHDSKLLDAWFNLSDGNKLTVLAVLAGCMVYRTTRAEGLMMVPVLGGAFAAMAYAIVLALRML